jgi:hypothetical protein
MPRRTPKLEDSFEGATRRFGTHLPMFRRQVGCYFWGLVNGRSQTQFPWGSPQGAPEPELWFHDLLRTDGRPYLPDEVRKIKSVLSA